ncbi:MAG: DoxX family protein [Bacteroidetes bacterium]|nr:DoxX family protein [Bacteroidota bacterium]
MFNLARPLPRRIALLLLSAFFVVAGANHFVHPDGYVAIMPPYLPAHLELVYISGVFEMLGGLGVLFSRSRQLTGWGLIALLVAIFPANLDMALHPEQFPDIPAWVLYARLPFQLVFIAWVWWATRPDAAKAIEQRMTG